MKKLVAILTLAISGSAFAASITIEGQSIEGQGSADQKNFNMTAKQEINKNFVGHVQVSPPPNIQDLLVSCFPIYP